MNYGRVAHIVGTFCMFISAMLAVPTLVAMIHGETSTLTGFGVPILVGLLFGWVLRRRFRHASRTLYRREGLLIVTGCWVLAAVIGAVPFMLSGMIPDPIDAVFESMSGFTTTGSTILTEIDDLPRGLMFWRSMTHWLGGIGIVVLFVAVLPALGVGGRVLYQFEVPGVETEDLKPRIRETALALFRIYVALTLAEIALLMVFGLGAFDAIVHTFGTVATGGFSNYGASIAQFKSPAVEIVITVFMLIAGVNFTLYHRARRDGVRVILADPEFRTYAAILFGVALICFGTLLTTGAEDDVGRAALDSTFQVVSVGTTTGYGTADFDRWPDVLRLLLVCLMFVGGSAGSTAGGMKVFRLLLVFKFIAFEVRRFIRPHRVRTLLVGRHPVHEDVVRSVTAFFCVSVLLFAGASVVLTGMGLSHGTALTSVAATLWNIGPGLEQVGPAANFAEIPAAGKVLLTMLMLFGRLEVFTALAVCMPSLYED